MPIIRQSALVSNPYFISLVLRYSGNFLVNLLGKWKESEYSGQSSDLGEFSLSPVNDFTYARHGQKLDENGRDNFWENYCGTVGVCLHKLDWSLLQFQVLSLVDAGVLMLTIELLSSLMIVDTCML
ncbi:hypothetical protein RHMOL_Rhmol04G0164900 [Rhododendron molle]|uniref:Uncharacterized protein n=1 Tax=Rhododendron molle TaxID=49168 RepID=A0ACC0P2G1_RHOML|nr:hypothetical protein RHMOL_Rhmol04G0164900 [Rhododendron molle]